MPDDIVRGLGDDENINDGVSPENGDLAEESAMRVVPVDIETEMKKSFIDYAMSVIADRALPDVRDGLKPVHRRILYAMAGLGFTPDKSYRKCATTTGEVMGKYHPHGDAAIYDSLVRMAQDFSLRAPLVDGHGNFGSRDGDPPAAQRYTEARLSKIAMEMLADINKNTVDFKPNYDDHEMEPVVLPSRFPNLLVNGSSGIAVGMATNIPPHNLREAIDAVAYVIDNPEATIEDLCQIIKGPDFPTAGLIVGRAGIRDAYNTGRGRIVMRARTEIESISDTRQRIVIHDLPYQVNKARLYERIAELAKEKKIDGIADVGDESDRTQAVRLTVTLRRDANANVVLNQLYKYTQLQETFNVNILALTQNSDGKYIPAVMNLRQVIDHYIRHQREVVTRRITFDLEKAEAHAHILEGLKKAIDIIDAIIETIRASKNIPESRAALSERFGFSEKQAQAIVELRLGRLSGLEREKIEAELEDVLSKIAYYRGALADDSILMGIVKSEMAEVRARYGDERRTEIIDDEGEFDMDDLIAEEECVITLTHFGYIKRQPVAAYKSQRRGGRGIAGLSTREEDFVETLFTTSTHNHILLFTNRGRVYKLKGYNIPESGRHAKGTAIVNLLQLEQDERVECTIPISEYAPGNYILLATKNGFVKKTALSEYANIRRGGLMAVTMREGDELIGVRQTDGEQDIFLVTRCGKCIRFNEKGVRTTGRQAMGIIGIRLAERDSVVGMVAHIEGTTLLTVTENGYGKRTDISEYTRHLRAGHGNLAYKITEKTGQIAGVKLVSEADDVIMISADGTIIRTPASTISLISRNTQGVKLMRTEEGRRVVSIARVIQDAESDSESDADADVDDMEIDDGGVVDEGEGADDTADATGNDSDNDTAYDNDTADDTGEGINEHGNETT